MIEFINEYLCKLEKFKAPGKNSVVCKAIDLCSPGLRQCFARDSDTELSPEQLVANKALYKLFSDAYDEIVKGYSSTVASHSRELARSYEPVADK